MDINKPDFSRVIKAVRHEEPDRVPLIDAAISYDIMGRFLGKKVDSEDVATQVLFWQNAGYDYIALTAGMMQPGKVTEDSYISKIIKEKLIKNENDDWNLENRAFINERDDFELFPWDEVSKIDVSKFHEVQKSLPDGMKIVALSGKIFTLSWLLMGYENFCVQLMIDYDFVKSVIDKIAEIQIDAIKKVISIPNVEAVWIVDDIAFNTGTIIHPDFLRKLIFPWYREISKMCHEKNKMLFYHSDGVLWDVMDDIIDIGFDAIHPIDPTCMDIEQVKKRVGSRICLFGNIPNDLLMLGSPEEVEELVKKRIKALAPGGGYCVASGNSIPEWAKLENYKAMIDAVFKYGVYPV